MEEAVHDGCGADIHAKYVSRLNWYGLQPGIGDLHLKSAILVLRSLVCVQPFTKRIDGSLVLGRYIA